MINKILVGNSLDKLKDLDDNSIDSIVTDPPYELGFMGKTWDSTGIAFNVELWAECLRVLKPGGHLLSFGGTRTWHRMAVGIEDAGFEIRDNIAWIYGTGFPKSLNIGKAIDKAAGVELTEDDTKKYEGWGTALKPAFEPIVVARKPLSEKTVAANVLKWGTGGINIDGSRIGTEEYKTSTGGMKSSNFQHHGNNIPTTPLLNTGRFPSNLLLDETTAAIVDEQSGQSKSTDNKWEGENNSEIYSKYNKGLRTETYSDAGGASRFFYVAKPSKKERPVVNGVAHPTVKPLTLMRYLVKLVTPVNGIVLDPFTGSGTTIEAAIMEGFNYVGIELTETYLPLIEARIERAQNTLNN